MFYRVRNSAKGLFYRVRNSAKANNLDFYTCDFGGKRNYSLLTCFFVTYADPKRDRKGPGVMKHENVYEKLIDRTICVIAANGMDKTTTKAIATGIGIGEVYIYRHFANKEDLLSKAFEKLDRELIEKLTMHFPVMYAQGLPFEKRLRFLFAEIWGFLLGNREKCLAYIRYYYSPYFASQSAETHKERFAPLVKKVDEGFLEEANTRMLMNYALGTMMNFAIKVFDGDVPNDEDTAEHVFRVIYYALRPYLKWKEES